MRICNSKSSVLVSLLCINSFNIENIQNVRHLARFSSVHFSHSVMSDSATPWTAAHQTSLSINSQSLPKLMSIESVMPSNHFIVGHPLLLLLSVFQTSRYFQMSQLFTSGGQSIGVSASTSVLPKNTQD